MIKLWEIDVFEAARLQDAEGVIVVRSGNAVLNANNTQYELGELALLKSTGSSVLEERLQGFGFGKECSTEIPCITKLAQMGNGVYMVLAVCPQFSHINDDDPEAKNDVVVLMVGDSIQDLVNKGAANDED